MKVILKEIEEHLPLIQLGVQVGSLFVKQQANQRQHQAYIDMEKHKYDKKIELAHGLTPALEKAVEKDPGAPISEVANIFYAVLNHDRDSDQEWTNSSVSNGEAFPDVSTVALQMTSKLARW